VRARFVAGDRSVLLVAPTGAGKTVSAVDVVERVVSRSRRVMIVVNRRVLTEQTTRKLVEAGLNDFGVLMAGDPRHRPGAPVQVASIQTLLARGSRPPADLIIVDEAHLSATAGFRKLREAYPDALWLGMTATPYRLDGQSLADCFDSYVQVATLPALIAQGYLVPPRVFAPTTPALKSVKTHGSRGDFVESDLARVMDHAALTGDIVSHWLRLAAGKRTVVFAVNVAHSTHIAQRFVACGVPAAHIDGTTPERERTRILTSLETGQLLVVSSCGVLSYGWDCPPTEAAIFARPTQSLSLYIQMAGRVLRASPGKTEAIILDHAGNTVRHGFVTDERPIDFGAGLTPPDRDPSSATFTLVPCPKCRRVLRKVENPCLECGWKRPDPKPPMPEERAGELREIQSPGTPVEVTAQHQQMWDSLSRLAASRNYKPGWVRNVFREKTGIQNPLVIEGRLANPKALTSAERLALWSKLEAERVAKGYKTNWTFWRFKALAGVEPPRVGGPVDRAAT